jgi:hypothetical protein
MVVMFRMTPEKKEKFNKKIDKMMGFLEEFKECLEDSEEYEDEEFEEPQYRGSMRRRGGSSSSMRSRYSRSNGDY